MFHGRTVIVVGAGASFEAGLPIGVDLKKEIADLTRFTFDTIAGLKSGDGDFYQELLRMPEFASNRRKVPVACSKISNGIGYMSSIDSFLEVHASDPDIQLCAKAAIIRIISKKERKSKLAFDRSNINNVLNPLNIQGTWYPELAHILFEKVDPGQLGKAFEPVTFVSFNYDRCLEWFVYNALKGLYFLDDIQARNAITKLTVLHPYGDVGEPAWATGGPGVDFGADMRGRLGGACKGIRTFTEDAGESDTITSVRKAISGAQTIIFLGFAFHPQNIQLLNPSGALSDVQQIYGTSVGMSEQDKSAVEQHLSRTFGKTAGPKVRLVDLECSEFMRQFKRTLAIQ